MVCCCAVWLGWLNARSQEEVNVFAHLIIDNSISSTNHEFRHGLNILVIFRVVCGLDTTQYYLKLVLDLLEGAGKESVNG